MPKMKITTLSEPAIGIPLSEVEFGSVVQRALGIGQQLYLVIAACDGTGHRWPITLPGGTLLVIDQSERVIVLDDVELVVGRAEGQAEIDALWREANHWSDAPVKPLEQYTLAHGKAPLRNPWARYHPGPDPALTPKPDVKIVRALGGADGGKYDPNCSQCQKANQP